MLLDFTFSSAGDLVAGFAFQLMNDLILYNAEDCMFWVFDSFTDLINGFLLLSEEYKPQQALFSFAFALHKSPLAYFTCQSLDTDFKIFMNFYTTFFTQPMSTWGIALINICWNVWYNWVDLLYEFIILEQVYRDREWTSTGQYLAKITSDILFKSTLTSTWNYKNSDVLNDEWNEPPPLFEGVINEINDVLQYYEYDPIPKDISGIEPRPPPDYSQRKDANGFFPIVKSPRVMASTIPQTWDVSAAKSQIQQLTACVKTFSGSKNEAIKTHVNEAIKLYKERNLEFFAVAESVQSLFC